MNLSTLQSRIDHWIRAHNGYWTPFQILENQLTQDDFYLLSEPHKFQAREAELDDYRTTAEALYTGQQHVRLMEGARAFREQHGAESVERRGHHPLCRLRADPRRPGHCAL